MKHKFSGLYDIQIHVQAQGEIKRLASANHPILAGLTNDKKQALVRLSEDIDRSYVPCRDFVLYIRDSMMDYPTAFASVTKSGQQAINLNMLPDYRTKATKYQVTSQIRK